MKNHNSIQIAFLALVVLLGAVSASAATAPSLGAATSFAILAGSGITNTGSTTVTGNIGTFPTTTITGITTMTLNGINHAGDATTQGAKTDLVAAYNSLASQTTTTTIVANLGGQTLTPGVYTSASSIGLTGVLTLDGGGNPNAVFVFKAGSTLTTASGSSVNLINNAQACNVFWEIGSSATLGTNSSFKGSILAQTSATLTTGASVEGRLLAQDGAVTMDTSTVTTPTCTAVVTPTPAPVITPTPTPTPSPVTTPVITPTPVPKLPSTGFGPDMGNTWNTVLLIVGATILVGLYVTRKKETL